MKFRYLLAALAATTAQANQVCDNVYDPMNQRWVLVCHEVGQQPKCQSVYDPMNQRWVMVCDDGVPR